MIGVVLDTNVVVSANLNDQGLEAFVVSLVLTRQLRFYVSDPLLDEYERVLRYADFLITGNKRHFPRSWQQTQVVNARVRAQVVTPPRAGSAAAAGE